MKEHEIRPQDLLDRYVELSVLDAALCFGGTQRVAVACVGCGASQYEHRFDKSGFAYAQCCQCGSLFQNPRPPIAAYEAFYRRSESSRYWAEVFYPAVAEVRREKIFKPRARRLAALCAERGLQVDHLIDVGAGYGIFLDEWRSNHPQIQALAIEPSSELAAQCRAKGFAVVEDIVENVRGKESSADLVCCFEVLEHVYEPLGFMQSLVALARPGGQVFVSTLGIDGFDLQTLWDKSSQISPPHHINFLSVQGFEQLFARAGLVDVMVLTPGQLDVDIVRNAVARDPTLLQGQRFLPHLLSDDGRAVAFQKFLVEQRLSSHVWVIGKKPLDGNAI
jgi:SAM-dependent methyltransferase